MAGPEPRVPAGTRLRAAAAPPWCPRGQAPRSPPASPARGDRRSRIRARRRAARHPKRSVDPHADGRRVPPAPRPPAPSGTHRCRRRPSRERRRSRARPHGLPPESVPGLRLAANRSGPNPAAPRARRAAWEALRSPPGGQRRARGARAAAHGRRSVRSRSSPRPWSLRCAPGARGARALRRAALHRKRRAWPPPCCGFRRPLARSADTSRPPAAARAPAPGRRRRSGACADRSGPGRAGRPPPRCARPPSAHRSCVPGRRCDRRRRPPLRPR